MIRHDFSGLWVYLSASPLLGLTLTLLAYLAAWQLHRRAGAHPLVNPVLIAVLMLVGVLWLTGIDYATYFDGAQFVHFLLGPATVALAIPLYSQIERLRRLAQDANLDPDFAEKFLNFIIKEVIRHHEAIAAEHGGLDKTA